MDDESLLKSVKWLIGTLFSGLGTTWLFRYFKGDGHNNDKCKEESSAVEFIAESKKVKEDHKTRLGKRHKHIRTFLLDFSDREMADFYGFETVTELLALESGENEIPKSMLKILCDFFFIKEEIFDLENEVNYPFKSFGLHSSEIEKYIGNGFKPVIVSSPNDRDTDLYCYILLTKKENGFYRVVRSDRLGRFKSGHGGKNNIEQLIHVMIKYGKHVSEVTTVEVDTIQWQKLKFSEFNQNIENRDLDWDCQDIFDRWFSSYNMRFGNELRAQWIEKYQRLELPK